jgi:hypothetical protein
LTRITVSPLILPNSFLVLTKKWVATNARQATLIFPRAACEALSRHTVTPLGFAGSLPSQSRRHGWQQGSGLSHNSTKVVGAHTQRRPGGLTGQIEHRHDAAVPRCVTIKGASFPRPHTTCIWAQFGSSARTRTSSGLAQPSIIRGSPALVKTLGRRRTEHCRACHPLGPSGRTVASLKSKGFTRPRVETTCHRLALSPGPRQN